MPPTSNDHTTAREEMHMRVTAHPCRKRCRRERPSTGSGSAPQRTPAGQPIVTSTAHGAGGAAASTTATALRCDAMPDPPLRVLIIDDHAPFRAAVRELLERRGFA